MDIDEEKSGAGGVVAAATYMASSVLLIVFNKQALSDYHFNFPLLLVFLQQACIFLGLMLASSQKWIKIRPVSQRVLQQTLPLSLSFLLYLVTGMYALQGVRISTYTTLRRLTVVFVLGLEYVMLRKVSSKRVLQSVAVMTIGVLIAGAGDIDFDPYSYIVVFIYDALTAIYLVTVKRVNAESRLNTWEMMFYNSLYCTPLLLLSAGFCGEVSGVLEYGRSDEIGFQVAIVGSTVLAFVLNVAIFFNTTLNSPLTQQVCGQFKDVGSILMGILFFSEPTTAINTLGISVGFLGSVLYAYSKYLEATQGKLV